VQFGTEQGPDTIKAEIANLALIREYLSEGAGAALSVPRTLATLRVGSTLYCVESAARGTPLSRRAYRSGYFANARNVENDFACVVEGLINLTKAMQKISGAGAIDPQWRMFPEELTGLLGLHVGIEGEKDLRGTSSAYPTQWIQHGDLSVENVFLDSKTKSIEVIDWADLAAGFPPLYDLFTLFFSAGYLSPAQESLTFPDEEERWIASFDSIFLSDVGFARTAQNLILHACEQLEVPPEHISLLLVEFLLIRSHYYEKKSPVLCRVFQRLLQLCLEPNRSVFGRFPILPSRTPHLIRP
jgi:hypothetical protein